TLVCSEVPSHIENQTLNLHDALPIYLDRRRLPHLLEPHRAGHRTAHPEAVPVPDPEAASARLDLRLPLRGHRGRRLPPPSGHQGSGGRLMREVTLIWAQARDGVIGKDNTIPWHISEDLAFFKENTVGLPVVM